MEIFELRLNYDDNSNNIETISMPECLHDIDERLGEFRFAECERFNEFVSSNTIWLNRDSKKDTAKRLLSTEIDSIKYSFRLLAKEYNIEVRLWINGELWKNKGGLWEVEIQYTTGSLRNVDYSDFDSSVFINNIKKEELKMNKGIEAKIVAKVAVINKETQRVNTKTIYGSRISEIDEDNKMAIIDGEAVCDIYNLIVDGNDEIKINKPTLEVIDARLEWARLKADLAHTEALFHVEVKTREELNIKKAEIELELSKISDKVEYNLIWEGE